MKVINLFNKSLEEVGNYENETIVPATVPKFTFKHVLMTLVCIFQSEYLSESCQLLLSRTIPIVK